MSLRLNDQEMGMAENVIERLYDLECLKLIIDTNFSPGHEHEAELNVYRREYTLYNMLAPLIYFFFSNRGSYANDREQTEDELEKYLRGWLTEPNFSWGITKMLRDPRPPVTVSFLVDDKVVSRKTYGVNRKIQYPKTKIKR